MNNLRKFATEADYSAATLNYPAVSWVVSGDTVHFDKTSPVPPVVNTKVKLAFTTDTCGAGKSFPVVGDGGMFDILDGIIINGVPYVDDTCSFSIELEANTNYLIEYVLKSDVTDVSYFFNIDTPEGCSSSDYYKYDILFPAQVTNISSVHEDNSINCILFESATPPTLHFSSSSIEFNVYAPAASISAYESAFAGQSEVNVYTLSQYNGNIPL